MSEDKRTREKKQQAQQKNGANRAETVWVNPLSVVDN